MLGASKLILHDYRVEKIQFVLNPNFECKDAVIKMDPKFTRSLTKIDENQFLIRLAVEIENKNNKLPFACEIALSGKFELNKWEKKENKEYVLNNTCAILFPYLRNLLFTVTLNANVAPYTLPVMNVIDLFQENQEVKY